MRKLLISLILLPLCSCIAAHGHYIYYNNITELDLHKIKSTEYTDFFGEPMKTTNISTGDGKYIHVWFHMSSRNLLGKASMRNLLLEFKDDQLNAFSYVSSFDIDKTHVDLLKAEQIKVGTSTKDDMLQLFGKPQAKALCPSLLSNFQDKCAKVTEIWAWNEFDNPRSFGSNDPRGMKSVFVMFDASNKSIDLKIIDIQ